MTAAHSAGDYVWYTTDFGTVTLGPIDLKVMDPNLADRLTDLAINPMVIAEPPPNERDAEREVPEKTKSYLEEHLSLYGIKVGEVYDGAKPAKGIAQPLPWDTAENALQEARMLLNELIEDLHPEDREVFAYRLAEELSAVALRIRMHNNQVGTPDRDLGKRDDAEPLREHLL